MTRKEYIIEHIKLIGKYLFAGAIVFGGIVAIALCGLLLRGFY